MTKSGIMVEEGMVAADWSVIKQGTRLWIDGYGEAVVEDTGEAIKGNELDLFFSTHELAKSFGRKRILVKILGGE